jgi:hypothetical protein
MFVGSPLEQVGDPVERGLVKYDPSGHHQILGSI